MKTHRSRFKTASVSHSRWLAYATASAATALAGSHSAEAAIHYSGLLNIRFPVGENKNRSVQLDQPGDFFVLSHHYYGGWEALFGIHGIASAALNGPSTSLLGYGWGYASKLSFGQRIPLGHFFSKTFFGSFGPYGLLAWVGFPNERWTEPGGGFIGFRFNNGAGVQYGWARIKVTGLPDNAFKLIDYAYGDPGDLIKAGQTSSDQQWPDQGSLGGLALGAAGLLAWRKMWSRAALLAAT